MLTPTRVTGYDSMTLADNGMATYYVDLPADYLHLLNCNVIIKGILGELLQQD